MQAFSFKERFIGTPNPSSNGLYAPLTLAAPHFLNPVDYKTFKSNKDEKDLKKFIKSEHKRLLLKSYGKGNTNRKMNP